MDPDVLIDFATRYTAAWCSHDAARVASFFDGDGSLRINEGDPAVGRAAITSAGQAFMTAFPDLIVAIDSVEPSGAGTTHRWTLTGMNNGPAGTGRSVRISGFELWRLGPDGLIAESNGHFDAGDCASHLQAAERGPDAQPKHYSRAPLNDTKPPAGCRGS